MWRDYRLAFSFVPDAEDEHGRGRDVVAVLAIGARTSRSRGRQSARRVRARSRDLRRAGRRWNPEARALLHRRPSADRRIGARGRHRTAWSPLAPPSALNAGSTGQGAATATQSLGHGRRLRRHQTPELNDLPPCSWVSQTTCPRTSNGPREAVFHARLGQRRREEQQLGRVDVDVDSGRGITC